MAFASMDNRDEESLMTEINMVPLIDVMLVLLIIFIVTAPLLTHAVKIELPQTSSSVNQVQVENIQLAIDDAGQLYWNERAVDTETFRSLLKESGAQRPQPEIHIRADKSTPYEKIAQIMSEAVRHGLGRIGFLTDPAGER